MFPRPKLAVSLIIAGVILGSAASTAVPWALAQGSSICGLPGSQPCELTGFKLLANPNLPGLRLLQVETKQGPRTFVAARSTLERFAKELYDTLEKQRANNSIGDYRHHS